MITVAPEIMEKVEKLIEERMQIQKCLSVSICPQCGKRVNHVLHGGHDDTRRKFTCVDPQCAFIYFL